MHGEVGVVLLLLLLGAPTAVAVDPSCYALVGAESMATAKDAPVTCPASADKDSCFMLCGLCTTPDLRMAMSSDVAGVYCNGGAVPDADTVAALASGVVTNVSVIHGYFWLDGGGSESNATECVTKLLRYMPRRDMILLFNQPVDFIDFIVEHVRYAILSWPWASSMGVSWDTFTEYVLPYAVLDEKRDLAFRWRPRLYQLLASSVTKAANLTDAMHTLANLIPVSQAQGALGQQGVLVPGSPVTWKSETSPAYLSPQQTIQFGASCTGTGIILVVAARSVGIPARLAGCSESVVRGDDHHWAEYWDGTAAGPFGDNWHTKEGVSAGNAGGPWDSPSGPMNGCLKGVVPGSPMDTLWATSWSSPVYLPTLWTNSSPWFSDWSFVGGVNRCGAYCGAWGCGVNQTQFWNQAECGPSP